MGTFLAQFPQPFLDDLVHGRCLPIIGSGFSLNAKLPASEAMLAWDGLGRKLAESLPDYVYSTALEAISAYSHEFSRSKLLEALSSLLHTGKIRPGKSHLEFCRLPFQKVATTNWDFLLEEAYAEVGRYCIPLTSEDQLGISRSDEVIGLLKIHGDLHHPGRLVATEEDYDSFLTAYPLMATFLSSQLIESTALFIGYSLDDPDFRQIWQVVKDRLGSLRRPAYVIQVDIAQHAVARFERRGVRVINLPRTQDMRISDILSTVFREMREYWETRLISLSTSTEPGSETQLSLPPDAQSRWAFFAVPPDGAASYKKYVYPIAEEYGFTPSWLQTFNLPAHRWPSRRHYLEKLLRSLWTWEAPRRSLMLKTRSASTLLCY